MSIPPMKWFMTAVCLSVLGIGGATIVPMSAQQDVDHGQDVDAQRDPCEQSLRPPGRANGLHRRCEGAGGGGGVARGDFNGDGFADLAVGVPFEDQDGINAVGGVQIFFGGASGLSSTADLFLDETDFGFSYGSDDHFGWALASGDFNRDTYADLAIGMPDRDSGSTQSAGRVLLMDGSAAGLVLKSARTLSLLPSGRGSAGEALVWADFNGDGYGDLAVGVPDAGVPYKHPFFLCAEEFIEAAGEVEVFYGGTVGLTQIGAQRLFQSWDDGVGICGPNGGIGQDAEDGDRFGSALAAGNFNGDFRNGRPVFDLVIGAPLDDISTEDDHPLDAGAIFILRGSANGLVRTGVQVVTQDTPGVGGAVEEGDQFGRSLAAGDFNADLHDDLAIGAPFEDLLSNSAADAGAVHVLFGTVSSTALVTTEESQFISQSDLPGVSAEAGDRFGWALAAGRFNSDFLVDLAIGSPAEDIGTVVNAGVVNVLHGSTLGLAVGTAQLWRQGAGGLPETAEAGDQFGYALSAWNYGRDDRSDLAIGSPFEDLPGSNGVTQTDAGAVIVIYGTASGLSATTTNPAQLWHQDVTGVDDVVQTGDRFGHALY